MKSVVCIALVLAVIGFVNAQSPPTAQNCTQVTGISFCTQYVTYTVANTPATWASSDSAAQTATNNAIMKVTNSTGCQSALAAYYCQTNFPRCSTYATFSNIANARCNAVNSACNVTSFPTGFTGASCVANNQSSVDGSFICAPTTTAVAGASCASPYASTATNFQTVQCVANLGCNTTDANPTCIVPNKIGDACTVGGGCLNGPLMGTTILSCIAGTCQYGGKRSGFTCLSNGECSSQNCTAGVCFESPITGYCTANVNCQQGLYCDLFNKTCNYLAVNAQPCGQLQANWSPVPCVSGFTCVRGNNGTLSKCMPNAAVGGTCSINTGGVVYDSPLCINPTVSGSYQCLNGTCTNVQPGTQGQSCSASTPCQASLTCQYSGTSTTGTCQPPTSVQCASTTNAPKCNTYQTCNCGTDLTAMGTCAVPTNNPLYSCSTQYTALQQCLLTNCNSATSPFIFYDSNSCGATNCLTQTNTFVCCAKGTVGANFVAPQGTPSNVCATPSPTPTVTATGTGTPVPIQSSKKSAATSVSVSFVAIIVAVIAFCL